MKTVYDLNELIQIFIHLKKGQLYEQNANDVTFGKFEGLTYNPVDASLKRGEVPM